MVKNNNKNNNDYEIVYSDDPRAINKNKNKKVEYLEIIPNQVKIKMRIEKNQRGGKIVTVLYNLPENPKYFTELAKKVKAHCGTGGTLKDGCIEIQGDHLEKIKIFLLTLGFKVA